MLWQRLIVLLLLVVLGANASPTAVYSSSYASRRSACDALTIDVYASPECDAEMNAEPEPPVAALAVDHGAMAGYTYMRVVASYPVTVYSAPYYGYPLYQIDPGFNFVTPRQERGDWVEINPDEWIPRQYLEWVEPSSFGGVFIQAEPARPFGWFLETMYASDRPGGPAVFTEATHVHRYQIAYIYATVNVDGLNWYLVGPGRWIEQRYMGLVRRVTPPDQAKGHWVAIDLYEQTLVAYDGQTMIFATLISSGLAGFSTHTGVFQVWGQRLNGPMSGAEGLPDYYRLENVPYALYFDGDISLHGTYWHDGFGYRRSHGCVNLSITDARWMYDWLGIGGWVYVYYSQTY